LLGRELDAEMVGGFLDDHPIVTLVGPGGIGKTTLALASAEAVADRYTGGNFLVELAGVSDDDDLDRAIARQVGHESLEAFKIGTSGHPTLVVLDNCETALGIAQSLARELTESDDSTTVLATSRVPLGLHRERVHVVEPLRLPDRPGLDAVGASPAVQLFLSRARQAGATWEATEAQLEAAAEIVRQLDGMPLAIELAAARARVVGPVDLLELLDQQLDVLHRPSEDRPLRHHSIRAAIYASYEPLAPEVKQLFRQLSLVRSEVDLDFIHRLTGLPDKLATLDVLTELVAQSLVVAVERFGATYYRLLEPIRAYGLEQLDVMGEAALSEENFVAAAVAFADETIVASAQSMSSDVLDQISRRALLLLAAVDATLRIDDSPARAYRLYLLFYAPTPVPRVELNRVAARILERWPDPQVPLRAEALAVMAHSAMWAGDDRSAIERADAAISDPDATPLARLIAHRVRGFTAGHQGNRVEGISHLEAAIAEAELFGGSYVRELRMSWASMLPAPARSDEAIAALEAAAVEAAEREEYLTLVWAAASAAHHQAALGELESARRNAERAVELSGLTDAPWATCAAHRTRASVSALDRGWAASVPDWSKALEAEVMIGDIEGVTLTIRTAAGAAELAGEHDIAQALWLSVPARRGVSTLPPLFENSEDLLRQRLGAPLAISVAEAVSKARGLLRDDTAPARPPAPLDSGAPGNTVCFGAYELDLDAHELRDNGERVPIEPQVFDVLAYLAARPGRMITKEELLDEIWGDRFVSPSALNSRIKSARAATGDDGKRQEVIRTVHGRGFMFVAVRSRS
jgi:predicted ATPase/DNA-binding winged helix-turn-helix (wHTH) protein